MRTQKTISTGDRV